MSLIRFNILLLEDVDEFLSTIDPRAKKKIIQNVEKAKSSIDPKVFKKLDSILWEFRTEHNRIQYRLLAFWDKRESGLTLVVATHGFTKKTDKVPGKEFDRACRIRTRYLEER